MINRWQSGRNLLRYSHTPTQNRDIFEKGRKENFFRTTHKKILYFLLLSAIIPSFYMKSNMYIKIELAFLSLSFLIYLCASNSISIFTYRNHSYAYLFNRSKKIMRPSNETHQKVLKIAQKVFHWITFHVAIVLCCDHFELKWTSFNQINQQIEIGWYDRVDDIFDQVHKMVPYVSIHYYFIIFLRSVFALCSKGYWSEKIEKTLLWANKSLPLSLFECKLTQCIIATNIWLRKSKSTSQHLGKKLMS